ncbi:MAG: YicC family protein [Firmicutes bacterium]|nr:YicC family protein [Bacillota bacterium]
MVRSMTGYGHAQRNVRGKDITVEIKSVNHKFFDFSVRTSRGYSFIEDKIRSFVKERISRGKVDVYVSIVNVDEAAADVVLNESLAAGYVAVLRQLGEKFGLADDISVSTVARYSDIFNVKKQTEDEDEVWAAVSEVLGEAVNGFIAMREAEGAKLYDDVVGRMNSILDTVQKIEERSPQTLEDYSARLRAKIEELKGDTAIDEQRLLTEIAIFADKIAVDEETVRLRSHFDQMLSMLDSGEAVGRKLDFIVQEMNREANTIGSKAQDAEIAHMVVEIKSEIEKIREQIQNIE